MSIKLFSISALTKTLYVKYLIFSFFTFYFLLFSPAPALAQCTTGKTGSLECPAAGVIQLQELLTRMINISVTLAFMAMTVWLAWSAIKFFITSGGDPKALSQAWSSVTWIFMGIVFMVLAYLALKLIFTFTGADVTKYCLGFPPYCI